MPSDKDSISSVPDIAASLRYRENMKLANEQEARVHWSSVPRREKDARRDTHTHTRGVTSTKGELDKQSASMSSSPFAFETLCESSCRNCEESVINEYPLLAVACN